MSQNPSKREMRGQRLLLWIMVGSLCVDVLYLLEERRLSAVCVFSL